MGCKFKSFLKNFLHGKPVRQVRKLRPVKLGNRTLKYIMRSRDQVIKISMIKLKKLDEY